MLLNFINNEAILLTYVSIFNPKVCDINLSLNSVFLSAHVCIMKGNIRKNNILREISPLTQGDCFTLFSRVK